MGRGDISELVRELGPERTKAELKRLAAEAKAKKAPSDSRPRGKQQTTNPIQGLINEVGMPAYIGRGDRVKGLNEVFWARLYAQENDILFDQGSEQFFAYNPSSGAWSVEAEGKIRKRLAGRIFELGQEWQNLPGLTEFRGDRTMRGIINTLKGEVGEKDPFRQQEDRQFIHVANGMLELGADGEVRLNPFSPEYRSRRPSPIAYDPKAECPKFERLLLGHLETDDRELLQKIAGQILLGRNLTQRIAISDGPGAAGKGAWAAVVRGVIGHENCGEIRTKLLEERFEIGRLMDKSLALGSDVPAGFLNTPGASRLKSIVGGDYLDFEKKNSNATGGGTGVFNVLITANTRLRVHLEGDRSAWERRLTIVRYDRPFTGPKIPDVHLILLREEGAGILNWMIVGLQKLWQDIKAGGDILLSERQKKRVEDLLKESDSLTLFLKENVQTTSGEGDLSTEELVLAYSKYCFAREWDAIPTSVVDRRLPDQMNALFGVIKRNDIERAGKSRKGYAGVKFRTDDEP